MKKIMLAIPFAALLVACSEPAPTVEHFITYEESRWMHPHHKLKDFKITDLSCTNVGKATFACTYQLSGIEQIGRMKGNPNLTIETVWTERPFQGLKRSWKVILTEKGVMPTM